MDALNSIVFQIVVMFILILCGVFLYKGKWISVDTNKQLSRIVISVVNPALMFSAYNIELQEDLIQGLLQAFVLAVIAHGLFIVASKCLPGLKNNPDAGLERFDCIYSNCAFIGIPLVSSVYGSEGVFYVTAYITIFNLLVWSHGICLMNGKGKLNLVKDVLLSPTILATLLGMVVFFFQIQVPEVILRPVEYIGSMNTPLAMLVSGVTIAQSEFWLALKNPRIYGVAAIKLIIVPILLTLLLIPVSKLWEVNASAWLSTVFVAACPVATTSTLLAIRYEKNEKLAAQIFGMTTLLSAITLPILVLLGSYVR